MNGPKMTMQERIEAFYRQSGGPNNPEIDRILQEHLLNGKDHGPKGRRETVEDAIMQVVMGDKTLMQLFQWRQNAKFAREARRKEELKAQTPVINMAPPTAPPAESLVNAAELQKVYKTLERLEHDMLRLQQAVLHLTDIIQQQSGEVKGKVLP